MSLPSKTRLLAAALRIMDTMAADKKPYDVRIGKNRIRVMPRVFSPKYFTDTAFFARHVPRIVGKRSFFEVGLGTGAIALAVRQNGARYVDGSDINGAAIDNTIFNFGRHSHWIDVRQGSLFRPFGAAMYDVIFWNHPYHNVTEMPRGMIYRSGMDQRYVDLESYFRLAKEHLNPGGFMLLGTSNIARLRQIFAFGKKYGYERELLIRETAKFAHRLRQQIDLRIYKFTPVN